MLGLKSTYPTKVRERRRRSVGTTVGNDAVQLSSERIGVVKEPREAGEAWPCEERAGEENERWWYGLKPIVVFLAELERSLSEIG